MFSLIRKCQRHLIKYKCLSCNKDYSNKLDEKLKKRFKNTFKFSNNDINRFILLLRKGFYPYEYMKTFPNKKFNETTLPETTLHHLDPVKFLSAPGLA